MPAGWSWLFGHSLVILRYTKCLPYNANVVLAMKDMSEDFKDTEMFLIDLWPGYPTSIIVFNPEACNSVSQKLNLPRPKQPGEAIKPIVGGTGLVAMNGSQWKTWRSLFNPGFSATNISNHVPFMVDCAQIFCEKLRKKAGRGIVSLDEYATQLTFDVIMKVTL
jgi:cytochrome P450